MNDPLTMEQAEKALLYVSADQRDTWVNIGNALKTEYGDGAFEMWDRWSQSGDGYNARDARSVWRSLTPGHVHIGTLIKLARDAGWQPARLAMSAEDKRRLREEADQRRQARQAAIEEDAATRNAMQQQVATACRELLEQHVKPSGASPYLGKKQIQAYGVAFPRYSVLIAIDDKAQRADVWPGAEVKRYFDDLPKDRPDHLSFLLIKKGDIIIPLRDASDQVWSVQVIKPEGKKLFPRYGKMAGCFHIIGDPEASDTVAEVEGYATGASVHAATGWAVVVALNSGNLTRVAQVLRLRYPDHQMVICGDDDPDTPNNPGRHKAEEVARGLGVPALFPQMGEVA